MLLSAETALEIERQKHENISTEATPTPNYDESVAKTEIHKLVKHLETQVRDSKYQNLPTFTKSIFVQSTLADLIKVRRTFIYLKVCFRPGRPY